MPLRPASIEAMRKYGQSAGAYRVALIAVASDGTVAITTWGKTRADCRALAAWSESGRGDAVALELDEARDA